MESRVSVKLCPRLSPNGRLMPAQLYCPDGADPRSAPIVIPVGWDEAVAVEDVEAVYVTADTPVELADAAIESGFYVLGQPRG